MLAEKFQRKTEKQRKDSWHKLSVIYSVKASSQYPNIFSQCQSSNKQKIDIFTAIINESEALNCPLELSFDIIEEKISNAD